MSYYSKYGLSSVQSIHPYTQAYIAGWSVKPLLPELTKINNFITSLVNSGAWNSMDGMWFLEASDSVGSLTNIINPSQIASIVGTPIFTAGLGWDNGSTANYLDTGLNMSTTSKFVQNNGHISVRCNTDVNQNASDVGSLGSFNSYIRSREPSFAGPFCAINNSGTTHIRAPFAGNGWTVTSVGHTLVQRMGSGTTFNTDGTIFKNGVKATTGTISGGSVAPSSVNFTILRAETAGTKQLSFASIGSSLSDTIATSFGSAVETLTT